MTEQCTWWQLHNAYTGPILIRDHFHVSVSAPLPKFPLTSCPATLLSGVKRLNQVVEFDLRGHLNEMSDSDTDYISTPSQLPDQGDSDFDPDLDMNCLTL